MITDEELTVMLGVVVFVGWVIWVIEMMINHSKHSD